MCFCVCVCDCLSIYSFTNKVCVCFHINACCFADSTLKLFFFTGIIHIFIKNLLKFVPNGPIYNKSASVQVTFFCQTLRKWVLTKIHDSIFGFYALSSTWIFLLCVTVVSLVFDAGIITKCQCCGLTGRWYWWKEEQTVDSQVGSFFVKFYFYNVTIYMNNTFMIISSVLLLEIHYMSSCKSYWCHNCTLFWLMAVCCLLTSHHLNQFDQDPWCHVVL